MSGVNEAVELARFQVENIGGITTTELSINSGTTILAGQNATNRTSFLQAIMAVMGSENVSLKRDADKGYVELSFNGKTYTRKLQRRNGQVVISGEPYLDDSQVPALFAFLLESNKARQAVARGEGLREILMQPIDTDAIQSEIDQLMEQKDRIDDQLPEADQLENRRVNLTERQAELQEDLDEMTEKLQNARRELERLDEDIENPHEKHSQLEEKMDELSEARSTLEDVRFNIETESQRRDSFQEKQAELEEELEEHHDAPTERLKEIDERMERLRTKKNTLDTNVSSLQEIIQFNREMVDGEGIELLDGLADKTEKSILDSVRREGGVDLLGALRGNYNTGGSVTDQLVDNQQISCWTCGSTIEKSQIQTTIEGLQELQQQQLELVDSLDNDLEELKSEQKSIRSQQRQGERKREEFQHTEGDLESCEAKLQRLRERRDEIIEKIETLEEQIETLRSEEYAEIIDAHKRVNELEVDRSKLREEYESVEEEIETVERQLTEVEQLRAQRSEITERLTNLRTRVERIEEQAVEEFNQHMTSVLEALEYENIDRIWIERIEHTDSRDPEREFTLHIVRSSESGTVYEDIVDHLSESEREVTGLVFALAGYLVHEVYEEVPFMLLDSLEAVDGERIAALISHLEDYVPYLVVALLSEDAAELDDSYQYVTKI